MKLHKCRFCETQLKNTFIDLGMSPMSNAFLKKENLECKEAFYPLHAYICYNCFLVQLEEIETPNTIFQEYAYFSSFSHTWLEHSSNYCEKMIDNFKFDNTSNVVEIASNDGYLLQYFKAKNINVLGIEPAKNIAKASKEKGIKTITKFFSKKLAKQLVQDGVKADLLIGNNVLAHVPELNDFVQGLKLILNSTGIITMEFPHLLKLIKDNQFDTIYHEHFSYFFLTTVEKLFASNGLKLFDVEELNTHGGSLRIYACHYENNKNCTDKYLQVISSEDSFGIKTPDIYNDFNQKVISIKNDLLKFMIDIKKNNKTIVGYGAPAKGNTLLNYCAIGKDFIDYTVDLNTYKQGLYLPGTHIPIYSVEKLLETKPDYILLLPWNLKDEIIKQLQYVRQWSCKFIIPIPEVTVI